MKSLLVVFVVLLLPTGAEAQSPANVNQAVNSITPDDVYRRIAIIADDSMMGRDTPSPGLEMTAQYIAAEFQRLGLEPGGDAGGYLQRYPLTEIHATLQVTVDGGADLVTGQSVVQVGGGAAPHGVTGPTVLVSGAGDLGGRAPIAGAMVLLAAQYDPSRRGLTEESQQLLNRIRDRGPAAVFLLADYPDRIWRFFTQLQRPTQVVRGQATASPEGPPVLALSPAAALELLGTTPAPAGELTVQTIETLRLTVTATRDVSETSAPNVVGILEGSDPVLKNEYLVYSAHMDHVGCRSGVEGDSIWNGADDDASGTIGVVELAEAFAMLEPRPKRSMIFLAVSGEEKGLWGSGYYADNPSVPIEQLIANVNADMIGRNWRDTIVVIGKEHSDLGATMNRVNRRHPELGMTAIDDIWPNERFYYRSDHYNFARKGVPVLFFFNGVHEDYHRPSDEVSRIDAEKTSRIVKLMFYLGLEVANAPQRPKWDPESYDRIVRRVTP
ncbi:MAG: M28 family peptidase [Gemmatimonadota bacterium]|nr:MAG: M28 family peptidase [Gemmatimonadota bacterium]